MLLEQVGEGLVGELLQGRHPVAAKLLQLVECVVVKLDQLAQFALPPNCIAPTPVGTGVLWTR